VVSLKHILFYKTFVNLSVICNTTTKIPQNFMNRIISFINSRKIAFLISFFYVGIGTLAICNSYGSDAFYGDWTIYAIFFTFPVTFISFMYRFAESGSLIPVYIIQFFMFILTFGILSIFIRK